MDEPSLLEAVAHAFTATGADAPGWPNPRPNGRPPRDDEYSRCLDPEKYRILGARAEAWVRAIRDLGLASAEQQPSEALWRLEDLREGWAAGRRGVTVRLRPVAPGAVPLCFGVAGAHLRTSAAVAVGFGAPAVLLDTCPDCGCDACDSGSGDLIDAFDERVLDVLTGAAIRVTTRRWQVIGRRNGWNAAGRAGGNLPEHSFLHTALADARAGRSRHDVVSGRPWW